MDSRHWTSTIATIGACVAAFTACADSQKPDPALLAQAKVEHAAAERTALTKVPGGVIKESELEREHGKLVWSFDVQPPKSKNIIEVQVDAVTGKVVSVTTETPADQAKEAAADKAKPDHSQ